MCVFVYVCVRWQTGRRSSVWQVFTAARKIYHDVSEDIVLGYAWILPATAPPAPPAPPAPTPTPSLGANTAPLSADAAGGTQRTITSATLIAPPTPAVVLPPKDAPVCNRSFARPAPQSWLWHVLRKQSGEASKCVSLLASPP
jgi:hypothetical protein